MRHYLTSIALLAFLSASCAKQTTTTAPAVPKPSSLTVANAMQTLSGVLTTANATLKTLRDNKTITEAETTTIQNYLVLASKCGQATDVILNQAQGANLTTAQKTAIIQAWAGAGITATNAQLSPTGQAVLATVRTVINQILAAVGGPQI